MTDAKYGRALAIRIAVLAGLTLVLVVGLLVQHGQRKEFSAVLSDYIDPDMAYQRVIINQGGDKEVDLILNNEDWYVSSKADPTIRLARTERVQDFIDNLFNMKFNRIVSSGSADQKDFGLQQDSGASVSFVDNQNRNLTTLYFGDIAGQLSEQYFSIQDEKEIFSVPTNMGFYLKQEGAYWTELRTWQGEGENAGKAATFSRTDSDGTTTVFSVDASGNWLDADGSKPDGVDIGSVARNFLRLEGQDVLGDISALPQDAVERFTIDLTLDDGSNYSMRFYTTGSETAKDMQYYAYPLKGPDRKNPDGKSRVYLLPQWRYEQFLGF